MEASRAVTAIVLGAALLLTGCSGPSGAEETAPTPAASTPAPTPTPTPTPTPSPSPTPEPAPTPGPDFDRTDEVGAQAAAVYAVDVLDYTNRTGDESALDRLEWPETCRICQSTREFARKVHSENVTVVGGETSVKILKAYPYDEAGEGFPLNIRVTEADATILNDDGDVIGTDTANTRDYRIELRHDGTTWRLINMLGTEYIG